MLSLSAARPIYGANATILLAWNDPVLHCHTESRAWPNESPYLHACSCGVQANTQFYADPLMTLLADSNSYCLNLRVRDASTAVSSARCNTARHCVYFLSLIIRARATYTGSKLHVCP